MMKARTLAIELGLLTQEEMSYLQWDFLRKSGAQDDEGQDFYWSTVAAPSRVAKVARSVRLKVASAHEREATAASSSRFRT